MHRWQDRDLEQGETLLELVIAILILGVVVIAVASGLALSVQASELHRSQAQAGMYVHNYAEALENTVAGGGYVACATASGATSYPAYSPPTGYTASVTKAEYLMVSGSGAGAVYSWSTSGCVAGSSTDTGVERLTLQVASNDNSAGGHGAAESLVVILRKPCTAASGAGSC